MVEIRSIDPPVTRIAPPKGWMSLNLRELWQYRDLLVILTIRDVKVKYKQAFLGIAWAVIVPVMTMVVFGTVFGKVANMPSDGLDPYLFYLAGLVPWQYLANSLTLASNSMIGQVNLLTKIYMPRLFMPMSACLANIVDFSIAFILLLIMMLYQNIIPASTIIFIPLLVILLFIIAFSVSLFLSALNVKYRDIKFVVPFLIQIWMYCSVLLPFSKIPKSLGIWRYLYGLNPMAGVIEGFRWCMLRHKMFVTETTETVLTGSRIPEKVAENQEIIVNVLEDQTTQIVLRQIDSIPVDPPFILLGMGLCVSLGLLLFGLYYFKHLEKMFADIA